MTRRGWEMPLAAAGAGAGTVYLGVCSGRVCVSFRDVGVGF